MVSLVVRGGCDQTGSEIDNSGRLGLRRNISSITDSFLLFIHGGRGATEVLLESFLAFTCQPPSVPPTLQVWRKHHRPFFITHEEKKQTCFGALETLETRPAKETAQNRHELLDPTPRWCQSRQKVMCLSRSTTKRCPAHTTS